MLSRTTLTEARERFSARTLTPDTALIVSAHHPELVVVRNTYVSVLTPEWSLPTATTTARWIDPEWFDQQIIVHHLTLIPINVIIGSAWLRMQTDAVKFMVAHSVIARWVHADCAPQYKMLCGLLVDLHRSMAHVQVQLRSLMVRLATHCSIDIYILSMARYHMDGVLSDAELRSHIDWELDCYQGSDTFVRNISPMLHRLPAWFIAWCLNRHSTCMIDEHTLLHLVHGGDTPVVATNLHRLTATAVQVALQMPDAVLRAQHLDRWVLEDYEQLVSHTDNTMCKLPRWIRERCDPQMYAVHGDIVRRKLAHIVCTVDYNDYSRLIQPEWLIDTHVIHTLCTVRPSTRDVTCRIRHIVSLLITDVHAIDRYTADPLPLVLRHHTHLPMTPLLTFIGAIKRHCASAVSQSSQHIYTIRPSIPDEPPSYVSELLTDIYRDDNGASIATAPPITVPWDGADPLITITNNAAVLTSRWTFHCGDAHDTGGVSREFFSMLGHRLHDYGSVVDGYLLPHLDHLAIWGPILIKAVHVDARALEIDLHPIICIVMCWWRWLVLGDSEPYPDYVIRELIDDRDWMLVLAPEAYYADHSGDASCSYSIAAEMRQRFDIAAYLPLISMYQQVTALSISPLRFYRTLSGGCHLNVTALIGALIVSVDCQIDDSIGDTRDRVVQRYRDSLHRYLVSIAPDTLEQVYRFWFANLRPDFTSPDEPIVSVTPACRFPCASSHTCVHTLVLPYHPPCTSDTTATDAFVALCINRGLENQRLATINCLLYQFQ